MNGIAVGVVLAATAWLAVGWLAYHFHRRLVLSSFRIGLVLVTLGLVLAVRAAYLLAQVPAVAVRDESSLWAELLNAGIVLLVGAAVIGMFFRYKDAAIRQAELDRQAGAKALQEAKDAVLQRTDQDKEELARDLGKISTEVTEMNHALKGIAGYGGIMADMVKQERRRHDLNNQFTVVLLMMHEMASAIGKACGRLGIDFDEAEMQKDIADLQRRTAERGERGAG